MTPSGSATFVHSFLLVSGLLIGGNALFNRAVDPYGAYGGCPSDVFQEFRTAAGSRVAKAELARHFAGTTVIVGSSRAEVGYDPESAAIPDGAACNLALSGTNFHELAHVLGHVLRQPAIRRIVLCFDFQQFDQTETVNFDFDVSRFNPQLSSFDYHCNLLLCRMATDDAIDTLKLYIGNDPGEVTPLGYRLPNAMQSNNDVATITEKLLRNLLLEREALGGIRQSNERLAALGRIVRDARAADVDLIVVIQPVHATMLEVYHCAGLWETHERWLADVVRIVAESSEGETPVWDFTGFSPYATESLLAATADAATNRWFWEASHCKAELGEQILRRIFDHPDADPQFGRRLTPSDLPRHLAELRAEHDEWASTQCQDAQVVRQLAIEAGCPPQIAVATARDTAPTR